MSESHRHGALTNSGSAALHRAMANVTGGKQSGSVGFKIIRMAIKWPTFGHLALVQQVRARHEIARFPCVYWRVNETVPSKFKFFALNTLIHGEQTYGVSCMQTSRWNKKCLNLADRLVII